MSEDELLDMDYFLNEDDLQAFFIQKFDKDRTFLKSKKRALSERFFFQKVPSTIKLVQLRTCRNLIIKNQNIESFSSFYKVCSGDDHTTGINSHHLTWRKVCDCK